MKTCKECIWYKEEFTECGMDGKMKFSNTIACKGFIDIKDNQKYKNILNGELNNE